MKAIGVDVGGTGIKVGVVDVESGDIIGERLRRPTPSPASRELLGAEIASLVADLDAPATLAAGVGFPAAVVGGVAHTAVNIGDDWLFADVGAVLRAALDRDVAVLNDCDAAGLAELHYGAARNETGTVVMVTLGTGIGTSLFVDRTLIPNIELGGLAVRGKVAGERATNAIREGRGLSWKRWARDVELFLQAIDLAVTPRLIVVGGGVSDESHLFLPLVSARPPILPAALRNDAGIVGAAVSAAAHRAHQRGTATEMLKGVLSSLAMAPDHTGERVAR